jgi:hypothetical protein
MDRETCHYSIEAWRTTGSCSHSPAHTSRTGKNRLLEPIEDGRLPNRITEMIDSDHCTQDDPGTFLHANMFTKRPLVQIKTIEIGRIPRSPSTLALVKPVLLHKRRHRNLIPISRPSQLTIPLKSNDHRPGRFALSRPTKPRMPIC